MTEKVYDHCVNAVDGSTLPSTLEDSRKALREDRQRLAIKTMIEDVTEVNKANGWHDEPRSFGEDIALLHSEVSEALEGYRKGDDDNVAEEMADVLIRLLDVCYRHEIDLHDAYVAKLEKNRGRGYRHGGKKL